MFSGTFRNKILGVPTSGPVELGGQRGQLPPQYFDFPLVLPPKLPPQYRGAGTGGAGGAIAPPAFSSWQNFLGLKHYQVKGLRV